MTDAAAAILNDTLKNIAAALLEQNRLTEEGNKRLDALTEKLADLEPPCYFTDRDGVLMVNPAGKTMDKIGVAIAEVSDSVDQVARAIERGSGG